MCGSGRAGCGACGGLAASGYFLRSSSGALGCNAPSKAAAAADTVTGRCEVDRGRRGGGGSLRFIGCWSSDDDEEEVGVLKSSGAGPPFPLTTSASLTTAEDGGVRAGRPFPLPLSEDESSERHRRGFIMKVEPAAELHHTDKDVQYSSLCAL